MAHRRVTVTQCVARPPAECWAVLRAFASPWHPMVERMEAEAGGRLRAFTVLGDAGLYRERLTYLSDSDRVLRYTHIEGIAGAKRYDASIAVAAADGGATVSWEAEIEAPAPRCDEIVTGTEAVFRAGLDALMTAPLPVDDRPDPGPRAPLESVSIGGDPTLSVLTNGRSGDTLCLFLHGIGGRKENWTRELETLPPSIAGAALDLRGYGGSALGQDASTVADHCEDFLRVAKHLGASRLVLVGLSFGAWLATSFAMRHGAMLQGLVLAGGCTGMSEASPAERAAFRESRQVPLDQGKTPADFAPTVVDVIAGPDASEDVREELTASMSAIPADTYRDALTCFTNPPETFDFSRLSMPVLFMTGEHDRLAPPSEIRGVADRVWRSAPEAAVRFEEVSGAGHVCNLEAPEHFGRVLRQFLSLALP